MVGMIHCCTNPNRTCIKITYKQDEPVVRYTKQDSIVKFRHNVYSMGKKHQKTYHLKEPLNEKSFPNSSGSRKIQFIAKGWSSNEIVNIYKQYQKYL